jgi:hypothetical protein
VDLSFPVDISIPSATPTPANADAVGRPFDDLLDDGLAQALAAAPGIVAVAAAAPPPDAQPVDGVSGVEALSAVATEQLAGNHLAADASTGDVLGRAAAQALELGLTSSPPSDGSIARPGTTETDISGAGRTTIDSTSQPGPTDTASTGATATTTGAATTGPTTSAAATVALAGVAAAAAQGASPHGASTGTGTGTEPSGPTAATNQALALGSTAPRALDPARVALTRQNVRPSDTSASAPVTEIDGEIADSVSAADTGAARPTDTREGGESATTHAEPTPVGADSTPRSGSGESRHGSTEIGSAGTDTFGSFATDKVRYLRDLAPAREIQRLAIDLDDARVAVRFADGAATVDVMSDPSSRLDSGWVSNVEKTLRQLDRPVDPSTPGEQAQDHRDHEDADSRRRDTPDRDRPQPSIDDERVRRWQDATRSLMTTPNTRN